MREVIHQYAVELDWMDDMAKQLDGYVENHLIKVPEHVLSGTRYACPIDENLTAFLLDVTYHEDVLFKMRNQRDDFVGIYFNLTEGDAIHLMNEVSRPVGRWAINLAIVDATLSGDYLIKAGSVTYMISIFLKKQILKEYIEALPTLSEHADAIFDTDKNTIIRFDRMTSEAWHLMNDFRKIDFNNPLFDTYFKATVYGLMSNFMDQIVHEEIILEKVNQTDIVNIITVQEYLIAHIKAPFPGITFIAAMANMSETKFKTLFKKITGSTAHTFFLTNKVNLAKEMLETANYSISQIADELNFSDASHLIEQFKQVYGQTPKDYLNFL
ncbi:AraC family transcriptional regulator [Pedobacter aquatilis]|uniref:helix-turn-helix domain-containing protein n=1 Tax=Pedobacter aquatilis TaxID=351343 RepID=UPI00292D1F01|nr:AraC family transcriptional regulator [Pedobacter aquatilis]